jgi:hypothetical protein
VFFSAIRPSRVRQDLPRVLSIAQIEWILLCWWTELIIGVLVENCSKCGELTTKGSLCSECIWEQDQLKEQFKFAQLPKGESQGGAKLSNQKDSSYKPVNQAKVASRRAPLDSDAELLIAIDELIELQKTQNILSKRTADAAGGILAFLLLSALGAFALWFYIALVLPNS